MTPSLTPEAAQPAPPLQTPLWQVSLMVQKRLSSQGAPSFFDCDVQPVTGSHTPTEHSPSRNEQSMGLPLLQVPLEQTPHAVQGSPSSHCAPSLPGAAPQPLVTGSQTPM